MGSEMCIRDRFNGCRKLYFKSSKIGLEAISDIQYIFSYFSKNKLIKSNLVFDIGLARGIDYYTGVIFEVLPPKTISLGSIAGGGRYDNLTEIFGLKNMSGIGTVSYTHLTLPTKA